MGNRIALLVSVMLTGLASVSTPISAAPAADECLAKPKGLAPAGKHWYYRTNRAIQRKCWYLGDEGEKIVAVAPRRKQAVTTPPVDAGREADARAELLDAAFVEQPVVSTSPAPPATPKLEAAPSVPDAAIRRDWMIASRWPKLSNFFASSRAPATAAPGPVAQSDRPLPVAAAVVEEQPPAVVDNDGSVAFGQILSALILLVVVGGTIMIFFRRSSASRESEQAAHRDEMSWTRPAATRSVSLAMPRVRGRDAMIAEIEQLLATTRDGHRRQAS